MTSLFVVPKKTTTNNLSKQINTPANPFPIIFYLLLVEIN